MARIPKKRSGLLPNPNIQNSENLYVLWFFIFLESPEATKVVCFHEISESHCTSSNHAFFLCDFPEKVGIFLKKIEIIEKQNFSMFNSSKENASIFNKNTKSCKKHKKHSFSPSFTKAYTNQFTNEQYLLFFQFSCRFGLILKLGIPNCMSPFPFNSTKFYQKQ